MAPSGPPGVNRRHESPGSTVFAIVFALVRAGSEMRMNSLAWRGILLASTLLSASCGALTGPDGRSPDPPVLPDPDLSLDPASLVVGPVLATYCSDNLELIGRKDWAVVDVLFGLDDPGDPADGPLPEDEKIVRAHGGVVLYRFNIPAVRAWLRVGRIPDVARAGAQLVREVPDLSRYDVSVIFGYQGSLAPEDDGPFTELGGKITHRFSSISGMAGIFPDLSVPELRSMPAVTYVEPDGIYCLLTR